MGVYQNMLELLNNLLHEKVLAIYGCGSKIYGLESGGSDEDYTVIVDSDFLPNVIKDNGIDYFVFGRKQFNEATNFKKGYLSFFLAWLDNTCLALDNLVYLDEGYKDEFLSIVNADWSLKFKIWLEININYFGARLLYSPEEKTLYNLYRLNSIVKNYKETGIFKSVFFENDKTLALDFKSNPSTRISHKNKLEEIFSYLEHALKEETE